ncbi:MAG: tRNA pseudouridine(55) synthase TruB [bacterium]|jgi:tRNA pseudouridine55 synthase
MSAFIDGFFNVIKPAGMTSFDVIRRIRPRLGKARVGHAGVIDKPASGVLPVGVGRATKLFDHLSTFTKDYFAWLAFGATSPTLDLSSELAAAPGAPQNESEALKLASKLLDAARGFVGMIEQVPPAFSNVKVEGKELYRYELAAEEVDVKPRKVEIVRFDITRFFWFGADGGGLSPLDVQGLPAEDGSEKFGLPRLEIAPDRMPASPLLIAEAVIECATGAYVRALARDIGQRVGVAGVLASLIRTRVGPFNFADAVALDALASELAEDRDKALAAHLLPVSVVVPESKRLTVFTDEGRSLSAGNYIFAISKRLPDAVRAGQESEVFALLEDGRLVARCSAKPRPDKPELFKVTPEKVFLS